MMAPEKIPFGAWRSPLTARHVAESGTGSSALPREIQIDGDCAYWVVQQPEENGRYVIMAQSGSEPPSVMTPAGLSVRSRVHEYGGGVYCVRAGTVIFVNDQDQRLYRQDPGKNPIPITPEPDSPRTHRYADGTFSPDGRLMLWVRERHDPDHSVQNEIVVIPADGSGPPELLVSGYDFFSNPRFNPGGDTISWLCWNQPQMPWDGTELWTGSFDAFRCTVERRLKIAGAEDISIFQPEWSPDGLLYYISDQTGWWNIHRRNQDGSSENICPCEVEFGYPQWLFGFTKYTFLAPNQILASYKQDGEANLGLIEIEQKSLERIPSPISSFENPSIRAGSSQKAWFIAGTATQPPGVWQIDLQSRSMERVWGRQSEHLPESSISVPQLIEFQNRRGTTSYAYFYVPKNALYDSEPGSVPPLIVMSHGGPTSSARPHFDLETQYWTTRGYAVLDVDYSGSVGYGRDYRQRLEGMMGVVDVQDCIDAANFLVDRGRVDPERLIARGSSAGGYVTLCALTFHDVFAAGGVYYGIADLTALVTHTHKFEQYYLDALIGPYPECQELYTRRSPINSVEQLNCPMIILQGLEDRVVPPEQSDEMVAALERNKLPYTYLRFEDEGHGFDRSETIEKALEAELYFYSRVLEIPRVVGDSDFEIINLQ
jgi:dipeptidyl aminopeptidase/acylaminoacyl peptidase